MPPFWVLIVAGPQFPAHAWLLVELVMAYHHEGLRVSHPASENTACEAWFHAPLGPTPKVLPSPRMMGLCRGW